MTRVVPIAIAQLFVLGLAGAAPAQGSKQEAKAMIEKAAAFYKTHGRDRVLAEITRGGTDKAGELLDRDLYIFAYDFSGLVLAHGSNPKLVGKNLFDMQDADGRYLIRGLIETAKKGSGWYYYKWSNPLTKKIDDKMAYVQKLADDLWIGCGVYGKQATAK
jgi:cytochrome c